MHSDNKKSIHGIFRKNKLNSNEETITSSRRDFSKGGIITAAAAVINPFDLLAKQEARNGVHAEWNYIQDLMPDETCLHIANSSGPRPYCAYRDFL